MANNEIEEITLRAMRNTISVDPPAPIIIAAAPPPVIPSAPAIPLLPPQAVSSNTVNTGDNTTSKMKSFLKQQVTLTNIKSMCSHIFVQLVIVFIVIFLILIYLKPPFIQVRTDKSNPAIAAPCSYRRAMIFSGIVTGMVAVGPILYNHRSKIMGGLTSAKSMLKL